MIYMSKKDISPIIIEWSSRPEQFDLEMNTELSEHIIHLTGQIRGVHMRYVISIVWIRSYVCWCRRPIKTESPYKFDVTGDSNFEMRWETTETNTFHSYNKHFEHLVSYWVLKSRSQYWRSEKLLIWSSFLNWIFDCDSFQLYVIKMWQSQRVVIKVTHGLIM